VLLPSSESMATILIIEDRPLDRKLLTAILRTRGHEIVEASDGREALDTLARILPDVVISDILMPTVDGYEFVRRMRETPSVAAIPVIFYTATYHEREARALAHRCGVVDILTKPSAAHVILATVDAAIAAGAPSPIAQLDRADFDREHLHLVNSTLAARIDRFEAEKERMKAILAVAEQIAAERDPLAVLNRVCTEARQVTLAQHAVVGLLTEEGSPREMLYTSGLEDAATVGMKPPSAASPLLSTVVRERRPMRTRNPEGGPEALGLPSDHSPVSSSLSVPIASSSRVYGWLSLRNKLGADEFTDLDELAALTLGSHAGIACENARLLEELRRRVAILEEEVPRTAIRVKEEERAQLSRTLHDQVGQVLTALKIDLHGLGAELLPVAGASRRDLTGQIESIVRRLDDVMESVRTTAGELRPPVLERLGLVAAIECEAEEFEFRSGARCRVDSRIDRADLEPHCATAVFRIVQEALTNVLQHARATRVIVSLRKSTAALTVSVADNGRGIAAPDLAKSGSLGLIGMRERSALVGGSLDVRGRRPAGTIVRLTVPLVSTRPPRGRAR
jgi:signal transduction histidine kinase